MREVAAAIAAVRWPPGATTFTIYPQSGRKRGEGNGVGPIKQGFVRRLKEFGWRTEAPFPVGDEDAVAALRPGSFDAWRELTPECQLPFVAEWETGNISSSHRALNKMAMALLEAASPAECLCCRHGRSIAT